MTLSAGSADGDADRLDVFDDLLRALASGLDVRDVFKHVSDIAARIVPHDEATLVRRIDGDQWRVFATTSDGGVAERCLTNAVHDLSTREPRLQILIPESDRGLRSALSVPVVVGGEVLGVFELATKDPDAYTARDLEAAQRLSTYLAVALSHQRLADRAHNAAIERERAAAVESSIELLRAIGDTLDIRSVFPHISEIAQKLLAHDAMCMTFHDEEGKVVVQVASTPDFPMMAPHFARLPLPDVMLIRDFMEEDLPVVRGENPRERLLAAGYRSVLVVFTRARDQVLNAGFLSKTPAAFGESNVPMARRIADHIALAVSHEHLAEAARQVAEAHARAQHLETRVQLLSEELNPRTHARVVGESKQWHEALKKATQVAATDTTVLLTGESGTGKEVVARFVHRASARSKGPFVAINCAALPEQLLESELFGYERGAFTSAQQAKPGQIEMASGGVLFLDEVSEMSLSAQAKFLRVLQEREFQRLGGTKVLKANIRVVAATNRDLQKAVERGDFREDLYYRLQVFDIRLAALRERRDDIPPLAEAFLQDIGRSFGRPTAGLSRDAREALLGYEWPGNVRELRNALERAVILSEGGLINAVHLSLEGAAKPASGIEMDNAAAATRPTNLGTMERETIAKVLEAVRWNKSKAAQRLGLSRTQLYVRMRKYGLNQPSTQ